MGYCYRILTSQGANASGAAYDYVVNGNMIGGIAFVAYSSDYGNTGVMTFVVNQQGVVFEKDLGEDTAAVAKAMAAYDPGDSWSAAESED